LPTPRFLVREWTTDRYPYVPSARDKELILSVMDQVQIVELRDGISITTTSHIGVIQLEGLTIVVEPKLAGDNAGVIALLEFLGTGTVRFFSRRADASTSGTSLLEFLVRVFIGECLRAVRGGLRFGYQVKSESLPTLRGRLLVREQFLTSRVSAGLFCEHDEFTANILENQVLYSALRRCQRYLRIGELRRQLEILLALFQDSCEPLAIPPTLARETIVYNRLNDHYRSAHLLAWLILANLGVDDLKQTGEAKIYSFLVNMNELFETFVDRIVARLMPRPRYTVRSQDPLNARFQDLERGTSYASMVPDLRVSVAGRSGTVPVDAKYKRYDGRAVSSGDLYQLSMYAMAAQTTSGTARALLVFPTENALGSIRRVGLRNVIAIPNVDLSVIGVHIPSLLADMTRIGAIAGHALWFHTVLSEAIEGAETAPPAVTALM
jgi:5-methylcytosine-specific restriction enzyme subunit McrC